MNKELELENQCLINAIKDIKDLLLAMFDEISFNDEENEIIFSDTCGVAFSRKYKNKEEYDLLKEKLK